MPRKPSVPPEKVNEAILSFKERVIIGTEQNSRRLAYISNDVWEDISIYLLNKMTADAIHTFAHKSRHGTKELLGMLESESVENQDAANNPERYESSLSSDSSEESDDTGVSKNFTITFSPEEWKIMMPDEIIYKCRGKKGEENRNTRTYLALRPKEWTPIIAEHFWEHTHLPCVLAFRRAKAQISGENYITIVGRCKNCTSRIEGVVRAMPPQGSRVLMECKYVGPFDQCRTTGEKRRLIGSARNKAVKVIVDDGETCGMHRRREANRLMTQGDAEPAILPTANALRQLKHRHIASKWKHSNPLLAIFELKYDLHYSESIKDIGLDPFFVYYWSGEQTHAYREYCKRTENPTVCSDATGSVVKNITKAGQQKTSKICLYEGIVYDKITEHSFTVCNMLSERHNNVTISTWLSNWLRDNVPPPREVCCDQSVALLSAVIRSFTQYSNLETYLNICAAVLLDDSAADIPKCFVRCDVAHFMKLVTNWAPLKSIAPRVREVYMRAIGKLIQSTSIAEIRVILSAIFTVALSDTDGVNTNGQPTPAQLQKENLLNYVSTGLVREHEDADVEEEYSEQLHGLENYKNHFVIWAQEIADRCTSQIQTGNTINPLYLPGIVPFVVKSMKLLPLWSAVMIPHFGFGDTTASSAAVESSFNKTKNNVFKNNELPTRADNFLLTHLESLRGWMKLIAAPRIDTRSMTTDHTTTELIDTSDCDAHAFEDISTVPSATSDPDLTLTALSDTEQLSSSIINEACPVCVAGHTPSLDAHKCHKCGRAVHAIPQCSLPAPGSEEGYGQSRVCVRCVTPFRSQGSVDLQENNAIENWSRKNKKQRNPKSYLLPKPHLRHVNLHTPKKIHTVPILKNGARTRDLKAISIKDVRKVVLTNTCAFDSLTAILCCAYGDSPQYSARIDEIVDDNAYFCLVRKLVRDGITVHTYHERAQILIDCCAYPRELMAYETTSIACEDTISRLIQCTLRNYPSAQDKTYCTHGLCKDNTVTRTPVYVINHTTVNGSLHNLKNTVTDRLTGEIGTCRNVGLDGQTCTGLKFYC